jgi:4'-phosphopantetheinyl transferase
LDVKRAAGHHDRVSRVPAPGEVHLHGLRATNEQSARGEPFLSADERERADRFRTAALRARFVAFRGGLRRLLGGYLGADPSRLRFAYGPHGRPELPEAPELRFNLSHADDRALLAITCDRAVGVDLEDVDPRIDLLAVADTVFAESERRVLHACDPAVRPAFFFRTWVRKEAYIKALGLGFALDPTSFAVAEDGAGQPQPGPGAEAAGRWCLIDVPDPPVSAGEGITYHAAVCLERRAGDPAPRLERFPPEKSDRS